MSILHFRKVAVLGAGVMGAQIAAHLANAGIPSLLFDLPAKEGPKSGIAERAIANLARLSPAPLAVPELAQHIVPLNYEEHLDRLPECDLVIEAIAERMDWKEDLYRKVGPHIAPHALVASNTSGLSITKLAAALPETLRPRFCGVHFFNPPRYMYLVELIPQPASEPAMLDRLETFLTTVLGKGVIRAKDTPNFIANRLGVFSILATMANAERFGIAFDVVDDLTGSRLGRAKSATFRTADVVGLDTLAHVVSTMASGLPDDPWHALFKSPPWLQALIAKGALGQKARAGVYTKKGNDILVLDPAKGEYVPSGGKASDEVKNILRKRHPGEMFDALRSSKDPQAQFLWAIFRDLFHYAAFHLEAIADNARDADLALRWGFGWNAGPFETWQAAGWQRVVQWIQQDLAEGKTLSAAPLPQWVTAANRKGAHFSDGSYSPARNALAGRPELPVYRRQLFPPRVIGERPSAPGSTLHEDDFVRVWTDTNEPGGDDVAILSFKSKMHAVSDGVLEGTQRAVAIAEERFKGLVIWHPEEPFCVGADLASLAPELQAGRFDAIERVVDKFQRTTSALKYSQVPTVAAVRGMALGGGAEYVMHCTRTVAALESYIGLVEVGVGLLPAGGGLKEAALRAASEANGAYVLDFLKTRFQTIATGTVSKSAEEARALGFLRPSDIVVMNPNELLYVAKVTARALFEAGHRPPLPRTFGAAGRSAIATIESQLVNMRDGGYISPHDFRIGMAIAEALCGGAVEEGAMIDEQWILDIERLHFVELLKTPKTQERIAHMLTTGKPLRN